MVDLTTRRLTPERLDDLPADAPEAIASRRDLARINAVMGNGRILDRLLDASVQAPPRLVEIGAGDGLFTLRLARRLARRWPAADLTLVDMNPSVAPQTRRAIEALGWTVRVERADVFGWVRRENDGVAYDAGWANLMLHHFEDDALRTLFSGLAERVSLFAACETRRTAPAHAASRLVGLIGANAVTRHDARVSVEAGFRNGELTALWPGETVVDARHGPFSQGFVAGGTP